MYDSSEFNDVCWKWISMAKIIMGVRESQREFGKSMASFAWSHVLANALKLTYFILSNDMQKNHFSAAN